MKSLTWDFLTICQGDSEGWAVWHQAGGNQVVVLGGTKIPNGIRGSGVLHSREQHFGVPAERGKLRQRWGRLVSPQDGQLWDPGTGPGEPEQGAAVTVVPQRAGQCPTDGHGRSWWPEWFSSGHRAWIQQGCRGASCSLTHVLAAGDKTSC